MRIFSKVIIAIVWLVAMFFAQSALTGVLWKIDEALNPNSTGFFSAIAFFFNPIGLGLLVLPFAAAAGYLLTMKLLNWK
jgi:hypothetical protein